MFRTTAVLSISMRVFGLICRNDTTVERIESSEPRAIAMPRRFRIALLKYFELRVTIRHDGYLGSRTSSESMFWICS